VKLPQIKRQNDLPVVLSQDEVKALIQAPKYLKHKTMLAMLYGCGLRSYELCNLELGHIDFDRNTVFVKKQKGKIDRYLPLGHALAYALKKYIKAHKPKHFLFYSQCSTPTQHTGITTRGVNWAVKEAKSKINSKKKITAHTLRHSYATHLLEQGVDLLSIQQLLGHAHIETTLVYLHVAQIPYQSVKNPLDVLYPDYVTR
jgi:site-specific recombinase XerD